MMLLRQLKRLILQPPQTNLSMKYIYDEKLYEDFIEKYPQEFIGEQISH